MPCTLPPAFRSMTGKLVRSTRSPALTTSDLLNRTTVLPSVFAVSCIMTTGSPLNESRFSGVAYVLSGHAAGGVGDTCPVGADIRPNTVRYAITDARLYSIEPIGPAL